MELFDLHLQFFAQKTYLTNSNRFIFNAPDMPATPPENFQVDLGGKAQPEHQMSQTDADALSPETGKMRKFAKNLIEGTEKEPTKEKKDKDDELNPYSWGGWAEKNVVPPNSPDSISNNGSSDTSNTSLQYRPDPKVKKIESVPTPTPPPPPPAPTPTPPSC